MSNEEMLEHLLKKFDREEVISFCKIMSEFYDVFCQIHYETSEEPCEDAYDSKWWKEAHYLLLETANYYYKQK